MDVVEHWPGRKHDLRSVSKSVTRLLLGMALGDDWKQDLGRTVESFFADRDGEMEDGFGTVTLENMLTMRAGNESNEMTEPYADAEGNYSSLNDEIRLYETDDPAGLVLARGKWNGEQLVDPGWIDAMIARQPVSNCQLDPETQLRTTSYKNEIAGL